MVELRSNYGVEPCEAEAIVTEALETRKRSSYPLAMQGLGEVDVRFCLGPGRCMISGDGEHHIQCAFCVDYPAARGGDARKQEIVNRLVRGN